MHRFGALRFAFVCALPFVLSACAQPWERFQPGAPESTVTAALGQPKEVYDLPNGGKRFMWPTQPMGETTVTADIDASGKVVNVRQVLQPSEFYRAVPDQWTRADVLTHFGRPEETMYLPMVKREVWTYRYEEDNTWYELFHFYFDDAGVLRKTQKSPDPLHEHLDNDNMN
ncbi:hypothetical protein FAZ69_17255 [Trinickia terrae]|uniref:Lipoprotein n=1 Tax=Trinickia terrae TaxID=2571161 RepID=A0A4U1I490_9BURK|nr:hypothetical protein [Trinickia terrae]TKC88093.1 hypothetical protein FAZ69_17255 [Trinickia terrae]